MILVYTNSRERAMRLATAIDGVVLRNTNGAKGLSDDTLRSLRIEDESDSEKHQGLAEKLQDPSAFCGDCKNYGEPNGCNRDGGYCVAWGLAQDAADILGGRE